MICDLPKCLLCQNLYFCKVYQNSWKYQVLHIARLALNNNHSLHYLFTKPYFLWFLNIFMMFTGAIQDFKLGGGALKKIAPSGGRRENFWGISCKKSRFHTKKHILSNIRGGGGARRVRPPPPPPGSAPGLPI